MRTIPELTATSARLEQRLEALHARKAELTKSGTVFDRLRALEAHVDLAHYTKQRLEVDAEREAVRAAELRDRAELDAARGRVGEKPTHPKAPAELVRAKADHASLEAAAQGMAALVAERSNAWATFRAEHETAIAAELVAEAADLEADMGAWAAARAPLAERWAALDRRWSTLERSNYATGSSETGGLSDFPMAVEGRAALPVPARFRGAHLLEPAGGLVEAA